MADTSQDPLRSEPGTYALLLRAPTEQIIEVGALGEMTVRPGGYVYVGSAFGPGGVRARVERHARGDGAVHWHVDYLRTATALEQVWVTYDTTRRECDWAATMRALPGATVPKGGFGASDCDCPAHLYRFDAPPSLEVLRKRLQARDSGHDAVYRVDDVVAGAGER